MAPYAAFRKPDVSCGELGEMLRGLLSVEHLEGAPPRSKGKATLNRELGTNDKRQMYFSLTERAACFWEA
ncbi:MAG: hypothetical protein ACLUQ6_12040 [Alistipes onderdonkii]